MAENNVGTFIVTVRPAIEERDVKRVEKEYTEKFKEIGEKCADAMNERFGVKFFKGGLKATLWASIAAMITAVLETGFEKANEELDGLLAKANLLKATAQQSEVKPYEMAMVQAVGASGGVSNEELQTMLLRFNYMRAQKDPTLKEFQEGDAATAFLNFMQGLSGLDQNNKVLAATKVFGRFSAGRALQIADLGKEKGGLNEVINKAKDTLREKLENFAGEKGIKIPEGDLGNFINTAVNYANKLYGEDKAEQIMRDTAELGVGAKLLETHPKIMVEKTKAEDRAVRYRKEDIKRMANTGEAQNKQEDIKEKFRKLVTIIQGPILEKLTILANAAEGFANTYGKEISKHGVVKGIVKVRTQQDSAEEKHLYNSIGAEGFMDAWIKFFKGELK